MSDRKTKIEQTQMKFKQLISQPQKSGDNRLAEPISMDDFGDDVAEQTRNLLLCYPLDPEAMAKVYKTSLLAYGFKENEIPSFFIQ